MAKYRQGRKRLLTSRAKLADVPLWEIWFFIRNAIWWLGAALLRLWQFNPFSLIARRQRYLYQFDHKGSNSIQPPWTERIGDCFRSEEGRKRRLLKWVQSRVPRLGVEDFTTCWHDGLALCSLLEDLCPGLCPRPHLLNPHHRVNNCRLGIKLAHRYLGVTTTLIREEEMAIADTDVEVNLMHLLQLLKWKHQRGDAPALQLPLSPKTHHNASLDPAPVQLVARGTGLKAGIVGRRAKFNILTDSAPFLDLHIEIQGPNNEVNSERITSLNQGLDRRQARARSPPGYPVTSEEEGKPKLIEDDVGNVFLRQKSVDEDLQQNVIPFDYQCVGEGRFLVTYIPRSAGTYFISIKSYEVDIEGSPFEVKVSDWVTSWNVLPKPRVTSFDMLPAIEETPARDRQTTLPEKTPHDLKRPSTSAQQHRMAQVSRQLTIMKKRVVKRVITRNGEEILLTPSTTLSQQRSADVSDMSEDEKSTKSNSVGRRDRSDRSPNWPRHQNSDIAGHAGREKDGGERNQTTMSRFQNTTNGKASVEQEDFSTNCCNITLSVTSFEDEQEEERKKSSKDLTTKDAIPPSSCPQPEAVHDSDRPSPSTQKDHSPSSSSSTSVVNYDMTPGMYPSSPKRLAKIPESPIHFHVRSQLLGPPEGTGQDSSGLYPVGDGQAVGPEGRKGGEEGREGSSRYSQHLSVSPRCLSPSSSEDASGEHSDLTDFDLSPGPTKLSQDFPDSSTTPNHHHHLRHSPQSLPTQDLLYDNSPKTSANRRRFEESLRQRDGDADDYVDPCSQLVSALTEFDSYPPKKAVGRSYSDGGKLTGSGPYNIRLTRLDFRAGDLQAADSRWRKAGSVGDHTALSVRNPSFQRQPLQPPQNPHPHHHHHHHHHSHNPGIHYQQQHQGECSLFPLAHSQGSRDPSRQPSPFTSSSSGSFGSELEEKQQRGAGGEGGREAGAGVVLQENSGGSERRRSHMMEARKKWRTFDGSTIVEEEGSRGRPATTWRFSLQGKRSHSFTAPGWYHHPHHQTGPDRWRSDIPYNTSTELENMSIIDKLSDDDDEILEVVIESDGPHDDFEREPSEGSLTPEELTTHLTERNNPQLESETGSYSESSAVSPSVKQTVRGNLSRQGNVTGSTKSSSETSTGTDKSRTTSAEPTLPDHEESEGRRFRTIQKQRRRGKGAKSVYILVPKAKTDKSTQVAYSEIKAETGWKPPIVRLHRRKKYLQVITNTIIDTAITASTAPIPTNPPGPPGLSRESSISGNTDLLSASPQKASRLSSKSSSFSETSLIFGSDVAEIPETLLTKPRARHVESLNGNSSTRPKLGGETHSKLVEEEGTHANERAENSPQISKNVVARDVVAVGWKELPPLSIHAGKREDSKHAATAALRDARPPPYGRARSDPQFSHRSYFPDFLDTSGSGADSAGDRAGSYLGRRPPRPRDMHVLDWMQRGAAAAGAAALERDGDPEHEQPVRQSTVDTLDSGIENESPNYGGYYGGFVSGHRRIHRRPYPWSIDLEPSLVRANAAAMELGHGHRRLTRRSYDWEMDLDPRLIQDNGGSRPTGDSQSRDSLQLTLGVIEAAVHHTVCRLLSASSVASSGSHRNLPNIHFRQREESRDGGDNARGSYSDSELYAYDNEEVIVKRKKRKRKRKPGGGRGVLSRASSTVKEDFIRSVPVLSDDPSVAAGMAPRQSSPDIAETKSDGRYSPYSVTDIPCFELPSHLRRKLLTSPTRHHVRSFPHPGHPPSSSSFATKHPPPPPSSQHPSRHVARLLQQQQSQESGGGAGENEQAMSEPMAAMSQTSSSGKASLALRRQVGVRSPTSSPELTSLGLDVTTEGVQKRGGAKKLHRLRSLSLENGAESDTNTSEDSLNLMKQNPSHSYVAVDVAANKDDGIQGSRIQTQLSGNPRIVIHSSGHLNTKEAATAITSTVKSSSTSTEDSYRGFGISRTQRHDLIDHLKGFRDLTEQHKWESPEGSRKGLSPTPSSENELCLTETSSCYLSQYSDPFEEPLSPASLFAHKSFFHEGDLDSFTGAFSPSRRSLEPLVGLPANGSKATSISDKLESAGSNTNGVSREFTLSPLQAKVAHACLKDARHVTAQAGSGSGAAPEGPDDEEQEEKEGEGDREGRGGRCVAFGAGLSFGQVGEQNNFQVWTERPGNSCVTVAVFGPRSHCVTETSVTYIGDNLYDVSYRVTSPGYYVIVVKWGEQSLHDSPYICKVTY